VLETFADHAAAFAYMPDDARPAEELVVRDLWRHALAHSTKPRPSVLADLGVEALVNAPIASLSRGERKRAELATTLVLGRPITILDEPFAAFDPIQLDAIFGVVRAHAKECGPVVASVHHLEVAALLADRILLLAEGRVLAFGKLDDLRERTGAPSLEGVLRALLAGDHAA
jgi:ABC-type multidrug transport system ATPase subunit